MGRPFRAAAGAGQRFRALVRRTRHSAQRSRYLVGFYDGCLTALYVVIAVVVAALLHFN